jgi:hypothetical protein
MFSTSSICQSNYAIGVNTFIEKTTYYNPNFCAGISLEKQFCTSNGIEIGVSNRHFQNDFSNEKTDFVFLKNFSISENYLTVSVLSKFHFKHFNIAFGPSADFLISWKNKSEVVYPYVDYVDKNVYYGLLTKVTRTIDINRKVSIEPEIRFNPIFSPFTLYSNYVKLNDRQYLGIGVTIKYKF